MEDVTYTLEFEKPLRELEKQLITLNQVSQESKVDVSNEIEAIEKKIEQMKRHHRMSLQRPTGLRYKEYCELFV